MWFACFISLLLGLLAFAGPVAIGAIFSLVVTGQYVAYSIPIACRFFGGAEWVPGPFSLGRMVSSPSLDCSILLIGLFVGLPRCARRPPVDDLLRRYSHLPDDVGPHQRRLQLYRRRSRRLALAVHAVLLLPTLRWAVLVPRSSLHNREARGEPCEQRFCRRASRGEGEGEVRSRVGRGVLDDKDCVFSSAFGVTMLSTMLSRCGLRLRLLLYTCLLENPLERGHPS